MTTDLFSTALSRATLPTGTASEVYATFTIRPPSIDSKRPPLDIAVAMDVSGSMSGSKIDMARKSLLKLVDHLTDKDRLSITAFDSRVTTVTPPTTMEQSRRRVATDRIGRMTPGSATNLSGGLLQALAHLRGGSIADNAVRRCLIFTDGRANEGITQLDHLAAAVLEFRGDVGISAFGYGRNHDAQLLDRISQDGEFYFIDSPDAILTAFANELGALVSTWGQNVVMTLKPADGVRIVEVLNDLDVVEKDGAAVITVDDLLAEQEYTVVVKLAIDARRNAHPRPVSLLHASVDLFDVPAKQQRTLTTTLQTMFVRAGAEARTDDTAVMDEVALQKAVRAQNAAIRLADRGDFAGAQQVLMQAADFCDDLGTDVTQTIASVTRGLAKDQYSGHSRYSRGGGSQARSVAKGMKRKRNVSTQVGGVDMSRYYQNASQQAMRESFEGDAPKPHGRPDKPVQGPPTPDASNRTDTRGFGKRRRPDRW